jgi:hypothetical protein
MFRVGMFRVSVKTPTLPPPSASPSIAVEGGVARQGCAHEYRDVFGRRRREHAVEDARPPYSTSITNSASPAFAFALPFSLSCLRKNSATCFALLWESSCSASTSSPAVVIATTL